MLNKNVPIVSSTDVICGGGLGGVSAAVVCKNNINIEDVDYQIVRSDHENVEFYFMLNNA